MAYPIVRYTTVRHLPWVPFGLGLLAGYMIARKYPNLGEQVTKRVQGAAGGAAPSSGDGSAPKT